MPRLPRLTRVVVLLALAGAVLAPGVARAQYRFAPAPRLDHRGQWGVSLSPVVGYLSAAGKTVDSGISFGVDLGISHGLADRGDELTLHLRPLLAGAVKGALVMAGYRTYFGLETWKTYADLQILVPVVPGPAVGARVGLGLMYDPSRRIGVSVSGGAMAAAGAVFVTGFDVMAGVQLRF